MDRVTPEALELLQRYPWPGNVRELQSILKQAILQANGPVLLADGLPSAVRAGAADTVPTTSVEASNFVPLLTRFVETRLQAGSTEVHDEVLALVERTLLLQTLRHTGGNQSQAAHILGMTRKTLRAKLEALGISVGQTTLIEEAGNLKSSSRIPLHEPDAPAPYSAPLF